MSCVLRPVLATGLLALALAGCGESHRRVAPVTATRPVASSELSRTAPASVSHRGLPGFGTTQHLLTGGARLSVTLRSVIDPLRGSGADLPPGARAVGVVFQIRSAGPRIYDSSATADISIVVSSGAVTPVLATRGVCQTPVQDFDRYITTGEDRVGCVVFAIDDGAVVEAVRFAPHGQTRRELSWAG